MSVPINPMTRKRSWVYVSHGEADEPKGSVVGYRLDANKQVQPLNWSPEPKSGAGVVNVRAVTHPPVTLFDDPDKDGLATDPWKNLLRGVDHYGSIFYGALRSSPDVWVSA